MMLGAKKGRCLHCGRKERPLPADEKEVLHMTLSTTGELAKLSPSTEPPTDAGTYAFKHANSGPIECFSVHKNDGVDPFVITYNGPVWVGHLEGQWSPKLESFFDES